MKYLKGSESRMCRFDECAKIVGMKRIKRMNGREQTISSESGMETNSLNLSVCECACVEFA